MARPVIVGTPTFDPPANTAGTANPIVLTTPTGAAIGETLIAVLTAQADVGAVDFGPPAGWARIGLAPVASTFVRVLGIFRHVLTAAPAASYSFTTPAAGTRRAGIMFRVQNMNAIQPAASSAAYGTYASGTVTMGAITVPEDDCLHLLAGMAATIQSPNAATISTPPTGMTLISGAVAGPGAGSRTALYAWQENADRTTSTAKTFTFTQTTAPQGTGSAVILQGTDVNIPPTADAGLNTTIAAGLTATLNGSGSADPGGTIVAYTWTQLSGTTVTLSGTGSNRTFTTPSVPGGDTLVFQLVVTDNDGTDSAPDTVTFLVDPPVANVPPVANAGVDQSVAASAAVTLNGSASSDSDGTIVTYAWTQLSGTAVTLSGTGSNRTFTAPAAAATLVFQLTVTDDDGATHSDSVTVTVAAAVTPATYVAVGTAPALTTSASPGYPAGMANGDLMLMFVASDAAATPTVPAGWTQLGVTASGGGVGISTFSRTATGTESGFITVSGVTGGTKGLVWITAYRPGTPGNLLGVSGSTTGADTNTTSTAISATGSSWTTATGDLIVTMIMMAAPTGTFTGSATGVAMTSAGSTLGTATGRFGGRTATDTMWHQHRDVPVTVGGTGAPTLVATAVGNNAGGMVSFVRLTETPAPPNLPPVADAGADQTVGFAQGVTISGAASTDPDGTIVSYAWTQLSGTAVTLSGSGANRTFSAPGTAGVLTFELTVTDNGGATDTATVNVTVAAAAAPVYVASGAAQIFTTAASVPYPTGLAAGDLLVLTTFSDVATTPTVPAGWSFRGSGGVTGLLTTNTWIRASTGAETGNFTVSVTGGTKGVTWVSAYRAVIAGRDVAAVYEFAFDDDATSTAFSCAASEAVAAGERVVAMMCLAAPSPGVYAGNPTAVSITHSAATLISQTGRFAGRTSANTLAFVHRDVEVTVGAAGTLTAVATANGANAAGVTGFLRLSEITNLPPVANAGTDQSVIGGTGVTLSGTASTDPDGTISSYTWTQTAGTAVTLAGTGATRTFVAPLTGGALVFSLVVTDFYGDTGTDTVTVTVTAPAQAPVADAGPDQNVVAGAAVIIDGSASTDPDGTIVSYAWTQITGPTVTLTGGPGATRSFIAPTLIGGTFLEFQLTVTDNTGSTDTDLVAVTVASGTDFYWNGTAWRPSRFQML
jgi:PKD domain